MSQRYAQGPRLLASLAFRSNEHDIKAPMSSATQRLEEVGDLPVDIGGFSDRTPDLFPHQLTKALASPICLLLDGRLGHAELCGDLGVRGRLRIARQRALQA